MPRSIYCIFRKAPHHSGFSYWFSAFFEQADLLFLDCPAMLDDFSGRGYWRGDNWVEL
jgi:hypothetical protein